MIRFAEHGKRLGETGLMTYLSCFFKAPLGVSEHDLHFQFHHLMDYVEKRSRGESWETGTVD
jgi:myo-inositol-1-phosphate synthase